MKKFFIYFGIVFGIFLLISITIFCFSMKDKEMLKEQELVEKQKIAEKVESVLNTSEWLEITENDKITLAFSSETDTVAKIKNYLKDNKMAIFYVYGGPFDAKMEGNYVICKGFNDAGMVKIYYSGDNYSKEYLYSFESMLEFAHKALTFEM